MRRGIADWSAWALAIPVLGAGGLVVVKPAIDHWDDLYRGDPFEVGTTTQDVQETNGQKVDRTRTTTTEDASSFPERLLGGAGVAGGCARRPAAFLAAAVLQRALLGNYGLRRSTPRPAPEPATANGSRRPAKAPTPTPSPAGTRPTPARADGGQPRARDREAGRERREALGLSQRELAKRAGISHTVVSRIEGGEHSPSPKTLERLADCASCAPCVLLPLRRGATSLPAVPL